MKYALVLGIILCVLLHFYLMVIAKRPQRKMNLVEEERGTINTEKIHILHFPRAALSIIQITLCVASDK